MDPNSTQTSPTLQQSSNPPDGASDTYPTNSQPQSSDNSQLPTDKFAHTRGKRKRTRPEDQTVLEEEYKQNPRPGKAARHDITSRVSLSDKEVQVGQRPGASIRQMMLPEVDEPESKHTLVRIWFQNRRQMTRKKCRTWQRNEITSIIHSTRNPSSGPATRETSFTSSQPRSSQSFDAATDAQNYGCNTSSPMHSFSSQSQLDKTSETDSINQANKHEIVSHENDRAELTTVDERLSFDRRSVEIVPHPGTREGMSSKSRPSEHNPAKVDGDCGEAPTKRLERTSSSIRLSMSLEGKAEVVLSRSTPSPPKKPQILGSAITRQTALQRSQSSMSSAGQSTSDLSDLSWPMQRSHGRSRDSRTWEFYCDSDARDALTKSAEHEQKGSAIGAISLIRSSSARHRPLTPSSSKQNSMNTRDSTERKKKAPGGQQKPKLGRTTSSYARLQGIGVIAQTDKAEKSGKKASQPTIWPEPSGDSDKENWEPGTQSTIHRESAAGSQRGVSSQRSVLQENMQLPSQSSSLGAMMHREKLQASRAERQARTKENIGEENMQLDDEVSAFMAESGHESEDDLDAVQNLLSLSQGAWQ